MVLFFLFLFEVLDSVIESTAVDVYPHRFSLTKYFLQWVNETSVSLDLINEFSRHRVRHGEQTSQSLGKIRNQTRWVKHTTRGGLRSWIWCLLASLNDSLKKKSASEGEASSRVEENVMMMILLCDDDSRQDIESLYVMMSLKNTWDIMMRMMMGRLTFQLFLLWLPKCRSHRQEQIESCERWTLFQKEFRSSSWFRERFLESWLPIVLLIEHSLLR